MLNTNHNLLFKAIILALCIISFVHVFMFPLYNINNERGPVRTYLDFEQSLCTYNIKKRKIWKLGKCPQYGIVTVMQGGRLGNQMWQYASVWAFARRTGLEPYVPRCIKIRLDQIFEQLSVPTFEEISHCSIDLNHFVKSLEAWNFTTQSIILPRFAIHPETVLTWVQDIVQEFTIRKQLLDKSQQILRIAVKYSPRKNYTFVGVHIRRTDYLLYLLRKYNIAPVGVNFFSSAMGIFEKKYQNVMFIIVSDDPNWCWKTFSYKENVYVTGRPQKNSPELDMAILASCNHTIYDYGTFGEWGAILAGGETIYYNLSQRSTARVGEYLKNWYTI